MVITRAVCRTEVKRNMRDHREGTIELALRYFRPHSFANNHDGRSKQVKATSRVLLYLPLLSCFKTQEHKSVEPYATLNVLRQRHPATLECLTLPREPWQPSESRSECRVSTSAFEERSKITKGIC